MTFSIKKIPKEKFLQKNNKKWRTSIRKNKNDMDSSVYFPSFTQIKCFYFFFLYCYQTEPKIINLLQ